ncbi:probable inactive receptor kinase At3g02880 [Punica granatum]|uniref:Protein kinase domain-containing protein n=2 Tax=Punica granatum TaxID=22663 RepID=A0A218XJJ5_PUNGR|nr:probable inactive receptor kinase At3g02880 [Punica granatum]OWM84978.1 hypothetical protein CDL15_Pgr027765 [Punica granatum]PKI38900.1 hypothetical protein CRG98_040708 [Punica granatum]
MKPLLLVLCLSFFYLLPPSKPDLESDRSALSALRSAVGGRSLLWNLSAPHCSWTGIICDKDQIVELRFPGMGLSGTLPAGVLGNLTTVQTISLRYNALSGSIPPDIADISALRNLYLQGNAFSGEMPSFLFSLQNLVRLNLASNKFSGPIPSGFSNLTRLKTLYLEQNQLNGSIPDLNLKLDQFNVSYNNLTGSVPSSLSGMPRSAFEGMPLCGSPLKSCNGTGGSGRKLSGGAITGIVIGSVLGLLFILLILFFLCRKKSATKEAKDAGGAGEQTAFDIPREKEVGASSVRSVSSRGEGKSDNKSLVFFGKQKGAFDLEDLLRASAEVLGKGTFGTTYKAALEMGGMVIAVKRLKEVVVSEKEFREKMKEIGEVEHENLVPLRAYYFNRDEKLLVYDYMPTGSLSALLHGNTALARTPLNWDTRSSIALGAARAIAHLHSRSPTASHGNIKSSNVLLTKSYEPRVSDFGLAHIASPTSTPSRVSGYRAPEVTDTQKVSQKADVYSFGVLLLELLTGKAPANSHLNEEGVDLPRWVQSVVREEWTAEVFDLELLRYQDVEEDMVQLLQLALDCTSQHPDKRPSMAAVATRIEEICRSSSAQEPDPPRHVDNADGSSQSQQTFSIDSAAPSSSLKE